MILDNTLEIVQVTAIGLVSVTFKLPWLFEHGISPFYFAFLLLFIFCTPSSLTYSPQQVKIFFLSKGSC